MSDNGLTGQNAPVAAMAKRNLRNRLVRTRYASPDSYPVTALLPGHARQAAMSRICYFPGQKLFYARLPKCANSTIVRTMAHSWRPGLADVRINRLKSLFNVLPWRREFEAAAKITVLREPVERAVSAWLDKGHNPVFIGQHRYAGDLETIPTLEQFLIALRDNDYYRNGHYLPQLDMIPGAIEQYDVGTVERLEPFLERVCTTYFGRFMGLREVRHHATDSRKKKLEINARERSLIDELYGKDIVFYQSLLI
ncbi:sulfotransferase family 2 domain-containing protein [Celeribacter sp.]|uniref:sulfotransferase family 2 domain-containing protein n=1 Tax=Celeribacter sp. TaxID=1890673 RepID=UPI003A94EF5A